MDPTTTLFTFMLQTHPSTQAVHLVGSWDNFSKTYSMQRDIRRDRGQWRGCYSFKDIICDGDGGTSPRRDGGLKMGETYYFYYELDGSTETHDPSLPSTTACPYLPGQTVNTLWVPVEHSLRKRSASLSSMREGDLKTMNPDDKFATPRPAPSPPAAAGPYRLGSAPMTISRRRSARSLSPNSSGWSLSPRKLFSRKASSSSLRDNERLSPLGSRSTTPSDERRSFGSSDGSRSRDISPDSLRRFLSDDTPSTTDSVDSNDRISLSIPEDIAEENEENEDDDNFATSTTSESMPFTVLSPPPTQHSHSSGLSPMPTPRPREASIAPAMELAHPAAPTRAPPRIPLPRVEIPVVQTQLSSLAGISFFAPTSPESPGSNDPPSFYHSEDEDEDDDDAVWTNDDEWFPWSQQSKAGGRAADSPSRMLGATLSTYSLPQSSGGKLSVEERTPMAKMGSPALVARNGNDDVPVGNTSLLTNPIPNSGLDDLVSELSWIADVIHGKSDD